MIKVEVNVPNAIGDFYKEDRDIVMLGALRHIVFGEMKKKEDKLKKAKAHIRYFEEKYKLKLEDFQKNMPPGEEMELHEDWVEWSYWVEVQKRLKRIIEKMDRLYTEDYEM
ncbi:MAG: hypothetical protein QME81_11255 [bacterium]|nr:hypothetical protein [bacterium]